jgi:hypothetical protein
MAHAKDLLPNPSQVEIYRIIQRQHPAFSPEGLPALPGNVGVFHPANPALKAHYWFLEIEQFADLKLLLGIQNHAIDHEANVGSLPALELADLPARDDFVLRELSPLAREAVAAATRHLLFGHVDYAQLDAGPLAPVVRRLLRVHRVLPVLVASDLTVQDGETKAFDTPSASFDTITIYGTGQIALQADCKFTAKLVQHLAA